MSDNKSYRIRTGINDGEKVIKVNLKQGVKTLNILSLEINPEDVYELHTSDYGVIVGRVLANGAFGVPNVKVSVFIPIDEADQDNYVISNEYPYKTVQSKNNDGVKYNLITNKPGSPGTFPSKRMVLDNDGCVEVFDKYWKYTVTTNESGDYMIFGVPTGSCQLHYDCDLSDIGIISQHPYDFIAKGYDANLFKSKTKFTNEDLASAVHIISQDKTVYVYPFWGDKEKNKIGITRNDIEINYKFEPSCVFMGSSITDPHGTSIGIDGTPNGANGRFDTLSTSVGNIEVIRKTIDGGVEELKDNVVGIIDGNGVWCYQIPMNLDRIGTDEYGNIVPVNDPDKGIPTRARVRFRISLTDAMDANTSEYTAKMLVPCNPELEYNIDRRPYITDYTPTVRGDWEPIPKGLEWEIDDYQNITITSIPEDYDNIYEFGSKTPDSCFRDLYWGKVYSVKQYYPRFHKEDVVNTDREVKDVDYNTQLLSDISKTPLSGLTSTKLSMYDYSGMPPHYSFKSSSISSIDMLDGLNAFPYNTMYAGAEEHVNESALFWFYYHMTDDSADKTMASRGLHFCFENDWINGCLYFPRVIISCDLNMGYQYFGKKNDDLGTEYGRDSDLYSDVYISGRHHWGGVFDTNQKKWDFKLIEESGGLWEMAQDCIAHMHNVSYFSRSRLKVGLLTKRNTNVGENVFYYRCGGLQYETDSDSYSDILITPVYRRLYSTDIIILGNLEDIYDHLPKLFEKLPVTTTTFPPISSPYNLSESGMGRLGYRKQIKKYEENNIGNLVDIFGNVVYYGNMWPQDPDTFSGLGYNTEYGKSLYRLTNLVSHNESEFPKRGDMILRRNSLFFGLFVSKPFNINYLVYDIPTFINTSRICELDVHNDSGLKFPIFFSEGSFIMPTNGMIDMYDISTNENRSAFATMNFDVNKHFTNNIGYRQYAPTPLVVNQFEGRLKGYIDKNSFYLNGYLDDNGSFSLDNDGGDKYRVNVKLGVDDEDESYEMFRFGKNPRGNKQRRWNGPYKQVQSRWVSGSTDFFTDCAGDLILTENSFYFYFGLRTGHSAIDKLMEKFIDGSSNDVVKDGLRVSITQTNTTPKCVGYIEVGSCLVETHGFGRPINYELYYDGQYYSGGTVEYSELRFNDLPIGSYQINLTGEYGDTYEKKFSITRYRINISTLTQLDDSANGTLYISSISGESITNVSGSSGTTIISLSGTSEENVIEIVFSKAYSSFSLINGVVEIIFKNVSDTISAEVYMTDMECISTMINLSFYQSLDTSFELNKEWTEV